MIMSREIKFRAWDKNEKWMYKPIFTEEGAFVEGMKGYPAMIKRKEIISLQRIFNNDNLIPLEYTGLKDMAGKEIYEGDILRAWESTILDEYYTVHQVKYFAEKSHYPAFDIFPSIDTDCNGICYLVTEGATEVIGNIYENPELLQNNDTNTHSK